MPGHAGRVRPLRPLAPVAGTGEIVPRLFVYGTLMPGRLRWPHLQPFAAACRSAAVRGILFDSGNGWPVAVLDGGGHLGGVGGPDRVGGDGPTVPGVLVEIHPDRIDACLALIDEVEDTATDELRRVRVSTTGGEVAWAYHFTRPVAGLTPIADWSSVDPAIEG